MRWKKILIAAALVFVTLMAALYAFVEFYDFNKFKPLIVREVKNATGRELNIKGDIKIDFGIRPTLVVEDVSFQNAPWSARPDLGRVKRLEVQMVVWPLILGKFDFAHLVLVEPDVIVEFDRAGTSNFSFDTANEKQGESTISPPPLIFSDIRIEKGLFTYKDAQSDYKFSVGIDHLAAKIPGFDEPVKLDFKGKFDDTPLTLKGIVGPIWAWVEPGYSLPAKLAITAGGATASAMGELRDPINYKDLAFDIAAQGPSIAEIAKLAGLSDAPDIGAFKLTAKVSDATGNLAIEKLDVQIGSQEIVAISLTGDLKDVTALRGVNLDFAARGQDSTILTQFGLPALPERGAFQVTARIADPEAKVFTVSDLRVVLGENEVNGQLNLNLAEKVPFLTTELISQKFRFGQFNLDLKMTDLFEKPAIEKIDLEIDNPDLAKVHLNGKVDDLMQLQGVDIGFQASGKDLANFKQVIGQPLPLRGAFSAAGKVLIPVHKNLKIPDLKITAGKNDVTGSLNLDLRGKQSQLEANLSLPNLDLPSVLLPELAKTGWAKGLGLVSPIKLVATLAGFSREIALKKVDLRAGTLKSAEVRLNGSVENLMAQRGIDLNFNIRGSEVANLKKIIGQSIPLKGAYGLSGKLTDPAQTKYKLGGLKLKLGKNNLDGSLDLNLSGRKIELAADLAAPNFTLQPVTFPALETLARIEDLGPLKMVCKLTGGDKKYTLDKLDFNLGREDLIEVLLKGTISDLSALKGMKLEFSAKGKDMSNFKQLGGLQIPFQGAFAVSGEFIDPAPKVYKIPSFKAAVGENDQRGWIELDFTAKQPQLKGELSSDNLDLRPLLAEEKEKSTEKAQNNTPVDQKEKKSKPKTKSLKSGVQNAKVFSAEPLQLEGLQAIDVDLKFRNKQVLLPKLALDDVTVGVLLKNGNLEIKPFRFTTGGGKADVQFTLRSKEKPAVLAATLDIDQLEIGPMLDKLGYQRSVEGNLDANFKLNGSGDSVAALMAGLNGNIRIAMSNGRAASEYLDLLEKYLGSGILRMLNPFEEKREYTPINCFVNQIEIKDGLADVKILLDTDQTSIFGAGNVNLKTERLDLGINPTPKKGAMPANISFSLRGLSQPFRLGGTLANPHLAIDAGRSAFVIGKMAGALALGPIGIAAFFADVSVGKKDACAVALGKADIKDQPSNAKNPDEKKKEKTSGGFFKRLFGK
jgi:uncharacterized protein involved in outer membrane biogenesis